MGDGKWCNLQKHLLPTILRNDGYCYFKRKNLDFWLPIENFYQRVLNPYTCKSSNLIMEGLMEGSFNHLASQVWFKTQIAMFLCHGLKNNRQ